MPSNDAELDVILERHESTLLVQLNRPDRANSVQGTLFRDVLNAVEDADRDRSVRAIITTGVGKTYCVGADMSMLAGPSGLGASGRIDLTELGFQGNVGGDWGIRPLSPDQSAGDTVGVGRWIRRILDVGKPMIAAINGGLAGGGLALALLHDVRIASSNAKFATNFVSLGVSPEMGMSWMLPRVVGLPAAFDLMTRTKPVHADEALELGLVEQVVEPGELLDAALARAESFAQLPPVALRMVKRLLVQATESTLEVQLEREWHNQVRLFGLPETTKTMEQFITKVLPGR